MNEACLGAHFAYSVCGLDFYILAFRLRKDLPHFHQLPSMDTGVKNK
jgi:hypothetical protein